MVAANLVEVAALVGDTARATMLSALMGGQSLTATELAYAASISRSTASGHLFKLVAAGLLAVTRQRRFAYYRIASPLVAPHAGKHQGGGSDRDAAAAPSALGARRCALLCALLLRSSGRSMRCRHYRRVDPPGHVVLSDDGGELTPSGETFLCTFGADLVPPRGGRRLFCQPCLDWSERRYHIKGVVGSAILDRLLALGWFKRERDNRALRFTPAGRAGLSATFGIEIGDDGRAKLAGVAPIRLRA